MSPKRRRFDRQPPIRRHPHRRRVREATEEGAGVVRPPPGEEDGRAVRAVDDPPGVGGAALVADQRVVVEETVHAGAGLAVQERRYQRSERVIPGSSPR